MTAFDALKGYYLHDANVESSWMEHLFVLWSYCSVECFIFILLIVMSAFKSPAVNRPHHKSFPLNRNEPGKGGKCSLERKRQVIFYCIFERIELFPILLTVKLNGSEKRSIPFILLVEKYRKKIMSVSIEAGSKIRFILWNWFKAAMIEIFIWFHCFKFSAERFSSASATELPSP